MTAVRQFPSRGERGVRPFRRVSVQRWRLPGLLPAAPPSTGTAACPGSDLALRRSPRASWCQSAVSQLKESPLCRALRCSGSPEEKRGGRAARACWGVNSRCCVCYLTIKHCGVKPKPPFFLCLLVGAPGVCLLAAALLCTTPEESRLIPSSQFSCSSDTFTDEVSWSLTQGGFIVFITVLSKAPQIQIKSLLRVNRSVTAAP